MMRKRSYYSTQIVCCTTYAILVKISWDMKPFEEDTHNKSSWIVTQSMYTHIVFTLRGIEKYNWGENLEGISSFELEFYSPCQ